MSAEAIADLVTALGELTTPDKNGNVTDNDRAYRYTRLEDIDQVCRPVLAERGWAWTQDVTTGRGTVIIRTTLIHTSGERVESSPLEMPCPRFGPQDIGSVATYGRRYQLAAMLGIPAGTDNDATDQQPRQATDAQKNDIWTLAGHIWPDLEDTARRDALAAEVAGLCGGARLEQLRDTQAVLVINHLTTVVDTIPDTEQTTTEDGDPT
jgi:hypothetical protein